MAAVKVVTGSANVLRGTDFRAGARISAAGEFILPGSDMTKHKRLILGAMAIVLLAAASCKRHGDEKKFHPSPLAGQLFSGQSLQTAERKLDMMAGNFDVLVDRTPLPSDTRPPYRLLVISRKNARIDGQAGELVVTPFNDRLMTSQFYSDDMAAARAAVEAGDESFAGSRRGPHRAFHPRLGGQGQKRTPLHRLDRQEPAGRARRLGKAVRRMSSHMTPTDLDNLRMRSTPSTRSWWSCSTSAPAACWRLAATNSKPSAPFTTPSAKRR